MRLPFQILFLTGRSDPRSAALSPVQTAFLDALPAPDAWKVRVNFPYPAATPPYRDVPLLPASWRNLWQFAASRRVSFAERHQTQVLDRIEAAERTFILAGSCGLELLANLRLPASVLARLHVFAYGPAARRRPACDCRLVQGRHDWISRVWVRTVDARLACGHLDYLSDPEVLRICCDYLEECLDTSPPAPLPSPTHAPAGRGEGFGMKPPSSLFCQSSPLSRGRKGGRWERGRG
jgi:hypothetical protein